MRSETDLIHAFALFVFRSSRGLFFLHVFNWSNWSSPLNEALPCPGLRMALPPPLASGFCCRFLDSLSRPALVPSGSGQALLGRVGFGGCKFSPHYHIPLAGGIFSKGGLHPRDVLALRVALLRPLPFHGCDLSFFFLPDSIERTPAGRVGYRFSLEVPFSCTGVQVRLSMFLLTAYFRVLVGSI